MIDTNPIADNKLAQNDEDLIKSVAGEVNSKDKQNNKSQSEIEEQIELGYIKLKSDINKVLSPIVQAMIEAGVDGGLITSLEAEIYSNARMTFFTRVANSDINNMEEISKNVQKESLKELKPLFIDGEVSHELSQLKDAPVSEYEAVLKQILKEDKDNTDNLSNSKDSILKNEALWKATREDAYKKAFGENAKEEDKQQMMGIYIIGLFRDKIIKNDLDEKERAVVIAAVKDLQEFGDLHSIDINEVIENIGITQEELGNNPVHLVNDFKDAEDAEIEEYINELKTTLEDAENKGAEEQKSALEQVKKDKYGIDAITRSISERTNYSEPLNSYQKNMVQAAIEMLKDPNAQMELDGFVYIRILDVLKDVYQTDSKMYVELFQAFNSRIPDKSAKLTDALMEAVISDEQHIIDLWEADNKPYYGKDGCKNVAARLMEMTKGKSVARDDDRLLDDLKIGLAKDGQNMGKEAAYIRFEAIKDRYSPEIVAEIQRFLDSNEYQTFDINDIQSKGETDSLSSKSYSEGYLDNMRVMMRENGTKGVKEYIDKLLENSKNKEEVIDAALTFFEQDKENKEHFYEKESVELRKDVYFSILVCDIDNPEIYERMRQIDRDTAKEVVKESLEEINDGRKFYNGLLESVQKLGKGLNEKTTPSVEDVIFDVEKAKLPQVDLLQKSTDGWELGD